MTRKTALIIAIIVLISLALAAYFLFLKPNDEPDQIGDLPAQPSGGLPQSETAQTPGRTSQPAPTRAVVTETTLYEGIQKNLADWKLTQNPEMISGALTLTENPNNEAILEAWVPFMVEDSAALIDHIGTTGIEEAKKEKAVTAAFIYEWLIDGNGGYADFSPQKKQQILTEYEQVKLFLR